MEVFHCTLSDFMTLSHDRNHCYKRCFTKATQREEGEGEENVKRKETGVIYLGKYLLVWGGEEPYTIIELRFVGGINGKPRSSERITLKRNEKCIKLCLIYGIYMLLTSRYKVLFPWSSLSLMYYLSVNVVHSEHNSYGNISVPTAALLHP